ncbi:DUF1801 domain-containing protein [Actinomadura sp. 3N407]|uniref:DUF1801 domain-containing protein n=1 Tax=Actinomadura sp. 3N407 TaxID=3457423 RepID=UPI003FCCB60B
MTAVDDFMAELDHPLKAEVQETRDIIKGVNPGITEQIKWNAPTFSFDGGYLVTFNLRATDRVHLVFHDPEVVNINSALLEGDMPGRRMTYFADMSEVTAGRAALEDVIRQLVSLRA